MQNSIESLRCTYEFISDINSRRKLKGWTWELIADRAQVSVTSLRRGLRGKQTLSVHTMDRVARVFGYKIKIVLEPLDKL